MSPQIRDELREILVSPAAGFTMAALPTLHAFSGATAEVRLASHTKRSVAWKGKVHVPLQPILQAVVHQIVLVGFPSPGPSAPVAPTVLSALFGGPGSPPGAHRPQSDCAAQLDRQRAPLQPELRRHGRHTTDQVDGIRAGAAGPPNQHFGTSIGYACNSRNILLLGDRHRLIYAAAHRKRFGQSHH